MISIPINDGNDSSGLDIEDLLDSIIAAIIEAQQVDDDDYDIVEYEIVSTPKCGHIDISNNRMRVRPRRI